MEKFQNLEKTFKNHELLTRALTHRSWVNEHPDHGETNERLEFLGDAILEFVVSQNLFDSFPDKEEGFLTALRANLVNTVSLAKIAQKLNLGKLLYLSKGEEEGGGRENPTLLANTLEAVIGALYLDRGLTKVKLFITELILTNIPQIISQPLKDAKSRLQELVQAQGLNAPRYEVVQEKGPDHAKMFTVEVVVGSQVWGKGEGKSKSEAAQVAAQTILAKIERQG